MKPNHILLIVNPVSGRMKTKTGLFEILDELYRDDRADRADTVALTPPPANPLPFGNLTAVTLGGEPNPNRRVTVAPTMYKGHAAELAARAAAEGYDTVICCGGDGTLNETVSGLLTVPAEVRPALGYIPAGSTNDFAASVGLSSSLRGAARTAVGDWEMSIDIGRFEAIGQVGIPVRNFSYIASFGVFTAASYSTPQTAKNVFGHMAYLMEGIKDLTKLQPRHAVVELADGTRLEGDYAFGAITNTTSAGGVVKLPAESVCMTDGEFEVMLVHHPRSINDLNRIATALWQLDFKSCPHIDFFHTKAARITLDEPLSWSLDGEEAFGGTRVEIGCLHRAIRLKTEK